MSGSLIRFDSRLIESAVLLAEAGLHPLQRARFRSEKGRCYEPDDPEERDRDFSRFHRRWFDRLGLDRPVERALDEHPGVRSGTERCLVLPVDQAKDEVADLRDETEDDGRVRAARSSLFIRVRPAIVADPEGFERFLAHELLHVADMLDPAFGYETDIPVMEGGPARANQVRDRYRVIWDCTIDGRLTRARKAADGIAERRQREFAATFPEMGTDAEERFRAWWENPRPSHAEILGAAINLLPAASARICPLCQFPYAELRSDADSLPEDVLRQILEEFPSWTAAQGLCLPCADLYLARRQPRRAVRDV